MDPIVNEHGQPIGRPLPDWRPPPWPGRVTLEHRLCRVEPFDLARHAAGLSAAYAADASDATWTYLAYGPFADARAFADWAAATCRGDDPLFFTIVDPATGDPLGLSAYLRIAPAAGSIEVGHVHFGPRLKRSAAATAAMFLLADHAFSLGYRRYEWKCDALNAPSRRAAERLGFTFEGVFRQAAVSKGRNRDTAWFSIVDTEWPALRAAYAAWLSPDNFDAAGRQRRTLGDLRASAPSIK